MKNLNSKIANWLQIIPIAILWGCIFYSIYAFIVNNSPITIGHYFGIGFILLATILFVTKKPIGNLIVGGILVLAAINLLQFLPYTNQSHLSAHVTVGNTSFESGSYAETEPPFSLGINTEMLLLLVLYCVVNIKTILSWFKK